MNARWFSFGLIFTIAVVATIGHWFGMPSLATWGGAAILRPITVSALFVLWVQFSAMDFGFNRLSAVIGLLFLTLFALCLSAHTVLKPSLGTVACLYTLSSFGLICSVRANRWIDNGIMTFFLFSVAGVTLVGHLFGFQKLYYHSSISNGMAIPTAICFGLFGIVSLTQPNTAGEVKPVDVLAASAAMDSSFTNGTDTTKDGALSIMIAHGIKRDHAERVIDRASRKTKEVIA